MPMQKNYLLLQFREKCLMCENVKKKMLNEPIAQGK